MKAEVFLQLQHSASQAQLQETLENTQTSSRGNM